MKKSDQVCPDETSSSGNSAQVFFKLNERTKKKKILAHFCEQTWIKHSLSILHDEQMCQKRKGFATNAEIRGVMPACYNL